MTQQEAMTCLKRNKKWITTKEVAEKTGMSRGSASKSLNILFIHSEIMRKEVKQGFHYAYAWKVKK